jgi:hypothetical protein
METVRDAVQIVATGEDGTRCALREAKRLAGGSGTRLVVLVPHVLSSFWTATDPSETQVLSDRYRALATDAGVNAVVHVCVCRRIDDVFRWMLRRHARIIVGGRRGWWVPSAAERIARRLTRLGHEVVFAAL